MSRPIVEVVWYDAYSPSLSGEGYWGNKDDLESSETTLCYTTGYLISNKDGWFNIAQSDANFEGQDVIGGLFRIPSAWVKEIYYFKREESKQW